MRTQLKRIALFTLALCIALLPTLALADSDTDTMLDGSGNLITYENRAMGQAVASDLYCFGQNVDASSAQIGESAILAGQYVSINNSTVGGSLRAAGYQVSAFDTTVDVNATLAAYSISLGRGFAAKAVYGAASNISFLGVCDTLSLSAQSVSISGTVNGDATIYAENVIIAEDAVITGTLRIKSPNQPVIAGGAAVGQLDFTLDSSSESVEQTIATVSPIIRKLKNLAMMLPGRIVLAVMFYFIIRKSVDEAAGMVKSRPAAMPVSGLVALISIPFAAILLIVTYVGIPAGMLLLCLYALALAFAVSFAGCMAGKLFFPKLHTLVAYIIGVAAVTVIRLIPFVGGLVTFACILYTLGYLIQRIYLGFIKKPSAPADAPAADAPAADAHAAEQV